MLINPFSDGLAVVSAAQCQRFADGNRRPKFLATGFGGTLGGPDVILIAPNDRTFSVFLTIGFVGLLQVVGMAFEYHASLFCV
jgi:hypothetical protein